MKIKETNKKDKKGFTMIEILIVVAIIAVLAITIIPMVSNYIQKGKDEYNEKLKNQLLVSGKEYYTNNKVKLPVKNYLGVYKNNKDYSYVTLPEIQSENYVSKDFVDADKRECSKSYVYVRQNDDGKDYEWHACLICSGEDGKTINYSKGDPACEIVDWGDTKSPTCDENANFVGGRNNNNKVFNPEKVYLQKLDDEYSDTNKNGKLAGIEIKNKTTNEVFYVKANSNSIKANEGIDLMSKITATFKEKQKKEGEYEISIYDTAGRKSKKSCASFIIDNTPPTCDLNSYQDAITKKLTLTGTDAISKVEDLSKLIDIKSGVDKSNVEGTGIGFDKVSINLKETKDQTYYGYVMDEAGNMETCNQDVKIKMIDGEKPYCYFTNTFDNTWYSYSGTNPSKELSVECYVAGGTNSIIDTNKISVSNELGTITNISFKTDNTNADNKVMFDFDFKPTKDKYGDAIVTIESGFVKDKKDNTNDPVPSHPIKVDSILPKIIFDPQTDKESGGWYKAPFRLNISCSDIQSGVQNKTFKVNGSLSSKNPAQITWNSAANPKTWTAECKDVAGNSNKYSEPYKIKENTPDPVCGVKRYKSCRNSACGCQTYKSCVNSSCSCATYNRGKSCGCAKSSTSCDYKTKCTSTCTVLGNGKYPSCPSGYSTVNTYTSQCNVGQTGAGISTFKFCRKCKKCTTKCTTYKRCAAAGCAVRNSCRHSSCGCQTYKSCRKSACGVESYKTCYHF